MQSHHDIPCQIETLSRSRERNSIMHRVVSKKLVCLYFCLLYATHHLHESVQLILHLLWSSFSELKYPQWDSIHYHEIHGTHRQEFRTGGLPINTIFVQDTYHSSSYLQRMIGMGSPFPRKDQLALRIAPSTHFCTIQVQNCYHFLAHMIRLSLTKNSISNVLKYWIYFKICWNISAQPETY